MISPGQRGPSSGKDESYLARMADAVPLRRHGSPVDPRVAKVTVRVEKSGALRFARSVGVESTRPPQK